MYIHIKKTIINIPLHINLNVLRKFMNLCWATLIAVLGRMRPVGHGLDSPSLYRMGLKKDLRNDNLFIKRVTDIIIPGYPLSIDM